VLCRPLSSFEGDKSNKDETKGYYKGTGMDEAVNSAWMLGGCGLCARLVRRQRLIRGRAHDGVSVLRPVQHVMGPENLSRIERNRRNDQILLT
jgi:hypothetical protein